MSKEDKRDVAKRAETALATANYFEKYGQAASGRSFVGDLLKFGKDGIYVAGKEAREIARGTQMVAYMSSLRCGWIRWEDGHPVEGPMGFIADGFVPPKRETLEDTPDESLWERDDKGIPVNPWQLSNDIVLFDPKGGQFYTFVTLSKGGLGAIGELCKEYGQHERQQPGEWPIVSLEGDSYQHKVRSRGRINYPILRRIRWVLAKDQPALDSADQLQIEQDQNLPGF
jgi:hypothetical protein